MKILILSILVLCPLLSYSGPGEPGGAGDLTAEHGSAWFLGDINTIRFCLETDPKKDFDTPKEKVSALFQKAFEQWDQYIKEKKIVEYHSIKSFTTKVLEVPCNGTEDLKIYLGVEDTLIKKLKSKFSDVVAFSHRQSYKDGWSKGLIWLAHTGSVDSQFRILPDFSNPKKLYMILLHEIGHLLGNDHVAHTIMAQEIYMYTNRGVLDSMLLLKLIKAMS